MTDLSEYSCPLREYQGVGVLRLIDNRELPCHFNIVQATKGEINAVCELANPGTFRGLEETIERLQGKLDDGRVVDIEKPMITRHQVPHAPGEIYQRVTLYCTSLLVIDEDALEGPVTFRFALTNLTIIGTRGYVIDRGGWAKGSGLEVPLTLGGFGVTIRPIYEYGPVVEKLKASRDTDVTCEATIEADSFRSEDTVVRLVDELCLLLTLARGCRVEWLYYDMTTSDGKVVRSYHRSAITKSFGTLQLIATNPAEDTIDFVERGYESLRAQESAWQLRKAILIYNDAKVEGDYLEMRGLKLAVAMEHIKGQYLAKRDRVTILRQESFDRVADNLVNAIRWLLPALFSTVAGDKLDLMAGHAQRFNWYPFRRALSDLCGELGLRVNSRERGRFINIRNELVHRAAFHPELGTEWEQYTFMITFIGKVLLAILGYDGHYYDWTKKPGWVGRDMEMRVKLDLDLKESSAPSAE